MGSFIRILSITLPWVFMPLAAAALLFALYYFWQSLRAALGLVSTADIPGVVESETRRVLIEKKKALLEGLADLKFERDAGKISDDDYERLDAELRVKAKRVLKLLDEDVRPFRRQAVALIAERLSSTSRAPYRVKGVPSGGDADNAIDAPAIFSDFQDVMQQFFSMAPGDVAVRADKQATRETSESEASESDPSGSEAGEEAAPATKSCSSCETLNDFDAEFCKKCGTSFNIDASEPAQNDDAQDDATDGGAA